MIVLLALLTSARPDAGDVHLHSARGYPFWVHAFASDLAVATQVRDLADEFWHAEMVVDGWAVPVPDDQGPDSDLDIYIDPTLGIGLSNVEGETRVPGTTSMSCYVQLPAQWASPQQMRSYVAHELNHTSQYAMNCDMDDAFFEHTAVWVEAREAAVFDVWSVGVPAFQANSTRALNYYGTGPDLYEYGAALWLMYYAQDPAPVQQLWKGGTNYYKGLDPAFFAGFAGWRTRYAGLAPHMWPGDKLEASLGIYGSAYFRLESPPDTLYAARGMQAQLTFIALDASGAALATDVNPATWRKPLHTHTLLVALTRAPADADASKRDFTPHKTRATVTANAAIIGVLAQGLGGDDDAATPQIASVGAPPTGCAQMSPWWWLVVVAWVGQRLRRPVDNRRHAASALRSLRMPSVSR